MAEQSLPLLTKYLMTLKVKNFKSQQVLQRSQMKCSRNGTILEMIDSELFSLLQESEFEDVDVFMVEVDQSGNEHRNTSSMVDNLFR